MIRGSAESFPDAATLDRRIREFHLLPCQIPASVLMRFTGEDFDCLGEANDKSREEWWRTVRAIVRRRAGMVA
jgi:hypothetical protein